MQGRLPEAEVDEKLESSRCAQACAGVGEQDRGPARGADRLRGRPASYSRRAVEEQQGPAALRPDPVHHPVGEAAQAVRVGSVKDEVVDGDLGIRLRHDPGEAPVVVIAPQQVGGDAVVDLNGSGPQRLGVQLPRAGRQDRRGEQVVAQQRRGAVEGRSGRARVGGILLNDPGHQLDGWPAP